MAKLKDVEYSLHGEQPQAETHNSLAEAGIIHNLRNETDVLASEKFHIFKLVNNNREGGVYVPNIDDVWNPDRKRMERIRLLSGVPSIWMQDQKDLTPEYIRQNMRSLHFPRGTKMLRISERDSAALEFARICNHNIGAKNRGTGSRFEFYEYDAAKEEKAAFEREDFELEMAIAAKQAESEPMKKHAAFLGIRLINDLGLPKGDEGIRIEYVRYAKKFPQYFKNTLGSKQVEISWLVRKCIVDSRIDIGREPGKVYWANGGGMICVMPPQTDAYKYLTDLASTNSEDGKRFLAELQKTT